MGDTCKFSMPRCAWMGQVWWGSRCGMAIAVLDPSTRVVYSFVVPFCTRSLFQLHDPLPNVLHTLHTLNNSEPPILNNPFFNSSVDLPPTQPNQYPAIPVYVVCMPGKRGRGPSPSTAKQHRRQYHREHGDILVPPFRFIQWLAKCKLVRKALNCELSKRKKRLYAPEYGLMVRYIGGGVILCTYTSIFCRDCKWARMLLGYNMLVKVYFLT